jgi:anti-sigma B factor antagonist
MTAAAHLEKAIRAAAETAAVVIIDLSEARFVDSSVMRVLTSWTERLHGANGRLPIVCSDPNLIRVFKRTGLDEILDLVSSRSAAAR